MAEKRLIIAVEGTPAMGPYWKTILSVYLKNIIRSGVFMVMIWQGRHILPQVFRCLSSCLKSLGPGSCDCLVQRSGWTKDVNVFLQWLASISFTDGGFGDAAIGEGLSEALMMFSLIPNRGQVHKHCILVGASNPYPFATPVYRPYISNVNHGEAETYLADAETVAKTFAQCSISLSVISPNQLPKLRAIYDAGKPNFGTTDPSVYSTVENPQFVVLLSETFKEACAAFSHGETCATSTHGTIPPISGPPPTSVPIPEMSQVNLLGKIGQRGVGMNLNRMNGLGALSISSGAGSMMPIPGVSQKGRQEEMKPLGVTNSSMTHMSLPQQTSGVMQAGAPDRYMRFWKGALYGTRQGQPAFITILDGYMRASALETFAAADWPPMMQIVRFIPKAHMHDKQYKNKAEFVIFRALNQHGFFGQMGDKLGAVIQLPSKTLLLCVSSARATCLIGMLVPRDMVVFEPQMPSQQLIKEEEQQQQHQQQQQQHQQHSLQQHLQIQQQHQQQQQMAGGGIGQGYV